MLNFKCKSEMHLLHYLILIATCLPNWQDGVFDIHIRSVLYPHLF